MKLYSELFEDKIRDTANDIYENSGRVDGRDLDNWLEAERIVLARGMEVISPERDRDACSGMPFEGSEY